jgi:pyrimidine-specific ribonucleoside hydrolase
MTVPVILDTDPGVDDAVALMLAAASPEVDLLAITTVFGNVDLETTTANALRLRALAGLGHVPVAAGAARPLVYPQAVRAAQWHATDGLGGRAGELPEPEGAARWR